MKISRMAALLLFLMMIALPLHSEPYIGVDAGAGGMLASYGGSKAIRINGRLGAQAGVGIGISEFYALFGGSVSVPVKQWRSFTSQTLSFGVEAGVGYGVRLANFRLGLSSGYVLQMMMSEMMAWSSGIFLELEPSLAVSLAGNGLISICLPIRYTYSKTSPSLGASLGVRFSFGGSNDRSWL